MIERFVDSIGDMGIDDECSNNVNIDHL
jgi:hypothetical protein